MMNDLKWSEYFQNNDKSLIRQLTSRMNALKMISGVATFKTRLMIANGIFCSKLIFQIILWGGTRLSWQPTLHKYIFKKLSTEFPYNTRLAQSESVRMGPDFKSKLLLTEKSFMNRATVSYNMLPATLRQISKVDDFLKKLKVWVQENWQVWGYNSSQFLGWRKWQNIVLSSIEKEVIIT